MHILSLDIATSMGWAFFDTDLHPSSIESGAINLSKPGLGMEKRRLMRRQIDIEVCALIDRFRPDVACLERPLNYIKAAGGKGKKLPMFKGEAPPVDTDDGKGGPNADTVLMLNQIFAAADVVCFHKCRTVIEVSPKTWQTLTANYPGSTTKERSIAFCRSMGAVIDPTLNKQQRGDAADAAVMTQWAAGHCQELKMMQRARAA